MNRLTSVRVTVDVTDPVQTIRHSARLSRHITSFASGHVPTPGHNTTYTPHQTALAERTCVVLEDFARIPARATASTRYRSYWRACESIEAPLERTTERSTCAGMTNYRAHTHDLPKICRRMRLRATVELTDTACLKSDDLPSQALENFMLHVPFPRAFPLRP